MNKVLTPFKAVVNNPIKSTIGFTILGASGVWFKNNTIAKNRMIDYCILTAQYGEEKLTQPTDNVNHLTVILNPYANKRKCKKLYSKWVEPLFHLAGLKVSVVEAKEEGQAYELMNIMSNTDCVAIVGGDGTVHQALNGLLAREDADDYIKKHPIVIIPAGTKNVIASEFHRDIEHRNRKEFLMNTAKAFVDNKIELANVTKIASANSNENFEADPYSDKNYWEKLLYHIREL